jgi:hypothetical protein
MYGEREKEKEKSFQSTAQHSTTNTAPYSKAQDRYITTDTVTTQYHCTIQYQYATLLCTVMFCAVLVPLTLLFCDCTTIDKGREVK